MEFFFGFVGVGTVILIAAMSPGPDFLVVSKNSIAHSRLSGVYTALGVAAGCLIHIGYTLVGIGYVISQSIIAFSVIKFLGAAYLVYLGVQLIVEKPGEAELPAGEAAKSGFAAFKEGFVTNAMNPKATIFFVSVFSQFMAPEIPLAIRALYGVEAIGIVAAWFVLLAFFLNVGRVRVLIGRVQNSLMKFMGAALLLFGVKLASSQQ